jgi:hypothetical protein
MKKKKIEFVYQPDPKKKYSEEKANEAIQKLADFLVKKAIEKMKEENNE